MKNPRTIGILLIALICLILANIFGHVWWFVAISIAFIVGVKFGIHLAFAAIKKYAPESIPALQNGFSRNIKP